MSLDLDKSITELQGDEQQAKRKNRRETFIFYGVGAIIFCALMAAWTYHDHMMAESRERMNLGETKVEAILDNKVETLKYTNGKLTYRVSYEFAVDGRSYSGTTELVRNPTTERQTALYDPQDPTMNRLVGSSDPDQFKPSNDEQWKSAMSKSITMVLYFLMLAGFRKLRGNK
jgi:hypothetical protein